MIMKNIKKFENFESEVSQPQHQSDSKPSNYMFFENLEQLNWQTKKLLEADKKLIDDLLTNGHDWADDHMSQATENVDQVFHFMMKQLHHSEHLSESLDSREELINHLETTQDVYDRHDLESMNDEQLKNLHDEVLMSEKGEKEYHEGEEKTELEFEAKKWIADAIKRPGALRKKMHKEKGEKLTKTEIDSELQALRAKDKDPDKPGVQLSPRDRRKYKQLNLAKTLADLPRHKGPRK